MSKSKKKPLIAIVDYQLSNLFSVQMACQHLGMNAVITANANLIMSADGLIIPGVGAFKDAMKNLKNLKLIKPLKQKIIAGTPLLGICLGLQLLFSESEEFGHHQGLDLIKGKVKKFPKTNQKGEKLRIPQIGWNKIAQPNAKAWQETPLKDLKNNQFLYFVHSYYVEPVNKKIILSTTNYGGFDFCSSIKCGNMFAVQFHPEKSADKGLSIYKNWASQLN